MDGFGIGWDVPELDDEPITFVSRHPAWSNRNLRPGFKQHALLTMSAPAWEKCPKAMSPFSVPKVSDDAQWGC